MADAYESPQAAACPAFVRATPIAWEIVKSSTGEVLGETTGLKEALDRASKLLAAKPLVLHGDSGAPNGEWRYLPAASAEDEPNAQDGVRLTERNIWQLAAGLNARPQAIPIDGGPGSVVHGTAHDSATPANGWAHHGIVVYDSSNRASLYLRAEMVPTVATMIDRGQLAYGSVHFFTSEPLDETGAPDEAGLISYGLTNTPADQRIAPASAVRSNHARTASRTRQLLRAAPLKAPAVGDRVYVDPAKAHMPEASGNGTVEIIDGPALGIRFDANPDQVHRWYVAEELSAQRNLMTTKTMKRGPAMDLLTAIAPKLGLTIDEALDEKDYCDGIASRLWKVLDAAKLEQILEGTPVPPAQQAQAAPAGTPPPATPPAAAPRSQAARNGDIAESDIPDKIKKLIGEGKDPKQAAAIAYSMAREALGLRAIAGLEDPAAMEAWMSAMLDLGRKVLGKPDADPAAVLTELQAVQDKLAGALGAQPPAPKDGTPADQQGAMQAQEPTPAQRALDEEVTRCRTAFARPTATPAELLTHARQTVERTDHAAWLAKAITDRKLGVTEQEREKLLSDCCAYGRQHVESYLAMLARPPHGVVMRTEIAPHIDSVESLSEAVDACMEQARASCVKGSPEHVVRARAQKIARKTYPHCFEDAQVAE